MAGHARRARVVAVVVAWNRQDLLLRTLDGLAAQIRLADAVIVVDNASTDRSAQISTAHPVVTEVVKMPRNTGGAGGFTAGIARAIEKHAAELVWVMDDDTEPSPTALDVLLSALAGFPGGACLAASRADWHDGREHPMNTPRLRLRASREERRAAASIGARPVRTASFVSCLIDSQPIREDGLPMADYFLWNDDFEFTARLLRRRVGLYVPGSRVTHLTARFGDSSGDPGRRFYNEVRNKIWTFTRSDAFAPWEVALYGTSTLARWARTVVKSTNRQVIVAEAWRGLRSGLRPPRRTSDVLADTPVSVDVTRIEMGAGRE